MYRTVWPFAGSSGHVVDSAVNELVVSACLGDPSAPGSAVGGAYLGVTRCWAVFRCWCSQLTPATCWLMHGRNEIPCLSYQSTDLLTEGIRFRGTTGGWSSRP